MLPPIPFARLARLPVLVAASALCACTGSAREPMPAASAAPDGAWALVELRGEPAPGPTLAFSGFDGDRRIAGHAGCNRYSAAIDAGGDGVLRFGHVLSTKMACADPVRMAREDAFLAMLGEVAGHRRDGRGRLQFTAADGSILATLAPASD